MKTTTEQTSARAPVAKAQSPKTASLPAHRLRVVPKAQVPVKNPDSKTLPDKPMVDAAAETTETSAQELLEYQRDFFERSILFWDTLRQRANNMLEHERAGQPPLLDFKYETLLDARTFERPANYALLRITHVGEDCWDDCEARDASYEQIFSLLYRQPEWLGKTLNGMSGSQGREPR